MASQQGNAQAAFTIFARDRALNVVRQFQQEIQSTTGFLTRLAAGFARANAAATVLAFGLPALISLLSGLVIARTASDLVDFEQAGRRAALQLQLLGLDATDAHAAISAMGATLDRMTATTLFQSREAVTAMALSGSDLAIRLAQAAQDIEDKFGIPTQEAFLALWEAAILDDPSRLQEMITGVEGIVGGINNLDQLTAQELLALILGITDSTVVTNAEKLADNLQRLSTLTLPAREAISEFVAGLLNILVESLLFHLEEIRDNFNTSLIVGLSTVFLTAGRSLGMRLGVGVVVGLLTLLLLDLEGTIQKALEDPLLLAGVTAIAFGFGRHTGSGLLAGLVFVIGLELLPGLSTAFNALATEDQAAVVTGVLAASLGLSLRLGIVRSLALGLTLGNIAAELAAGSTRDAAIMKIAFMLLGGTLGALFGGPFGAVAGALIGAALADLVNNTFPNFFSTVILGWRRMGVLIANTFIMDLNSVGNALEEFINDRVLRPIRELIDVLNVILQALGQGRIELPRHGFIDIPELDLLPIPQPSPGNNSPPGPPIPGRVRTPGGPPIVVQLVLDNRVMQEFVIDTVSGEVHQRSGILPGAAGA